MKRFAIGAWVVVGVVAVCMVSALRAQTGGQLYLVTGVSFPQYVTLKVPSVVYAVDTSKRVAAPIAELVSAKDGSIFVQADHDRRVIVVGSWHEESRLVVLSMDEPSKPRSFPAAYDGWFGDFLL